MNANFCSRVLLTCVLAAFASGCTDAVNFASTQQLKTGIIDDNVPPSDDNTPPVEEPPVVEPPPEEPPVVVVPPAPAPSPLTQWTAACPSGRLGNGKLTSCMSCPEPQPGSDLSSKAKRLLDTMDRACRIPNKSAPAGYVPPTRDELIHRLRACSPQIYPDTVLTPQEQGVIPALAQGNSGLLNRMFSGLWYQPPYSDAFDHYFGLGVEEAVPLFCHKTKTQITGELWSRDMWTWSYKDEFRYWPKELRELHAYYQHVRSGLVACLDRNGTGGPNGPIATPGQGETTPTCDIKGYSGENFEELKTRANELLSAGYTVSLESSVACLMVTEANFSATSGSVNLVGMKCE